MSITDEVDPDLLDPTKHLSAEQLALLIIVKELRFADVTDVDEVQLLARFIAAGLSAATYESAETDTPLADQVAATRRFGLPGVPGAAGGSIGVLLDPAVRAAQQ